MTSRTKAREWEEAVELMLSIASQIRCRAVDAPIVRSVIAMSLSMDPTKPTIFKCEWAWAWAAEIWPEEEHVFVIIRAAR